MSYFGPSILLLIPPLILALWAQAKVRSTYAKYSRVRVRSGLTGADVAKLILREESIPLTGHPEAMAGQPACALTAIPGRMSDHYDPRSRTLRLSEDVYNGSSVAALGIAAHEVGHAIQHARAYAPLAVRNIVYPACSIGSQLAFPLFFIGLIFRTPMLLQLGILLFTLAVAFTVITLPIEFNASRRALRALANSQYLDADEMKGARAVLTAAAMTYVAAATMAVAQLARMLILSRRS